MREIKYRAWETEYKKIVPVHRLIFRQDTNQLVFIEVDWKLLGEQYPPSPILRDVPERIVLMQFTGVNDKNGKPIYEGDIIDWLNIRMYSEPLRQRMVVKFENCKFVAETPDGMKFDLGNYSQNQLEIVGNIYEKAEIFKEMN